MGEDDRRSARTRQAVRAAFFELLFERGYDRLTVAGVIERANIGRSTFYEHYRTKQDLLGQSLGGPMEVLAGAIGAALPAPGLAPLLAHFRENQRLARELFAPGRNRTLLRRVLTGCIEARLAGMAAGRVPMLPLSAVAVQLAEMQLGLVEVWALGRVACGAEQVAAALAAAGFAAAGALLG